MVVGAVKKLNDNAETLMEFVSGRVVEDYKKNVEFGMVYNEEASEIREEINQFIMQADSINHMMKEMVVQFDRINNSIDENTRGISGAAGSANSLVSLMGDVSDAVRTSKNAVDGLDKSIEKFR